MSLLSIVQSVSDEVGFPRPSFVASSTDQLARQMLSLANKELREISKKYNWPKLVKDYTIPIVAGVATYDLPDDYRSWVSESAYRTGDYWGVRGSVSPQEWQYRKREMLNSLDQMAFRLYGNPLQVHFNPMPAQADSFTFEYVSSSYVTTVTNDFAPEYVNDGDVSVIDEDLVQIGLKWRAMRAKGLEYSAELAEYNAVIPREYSKAIASPIVHVGGNSHRSPLTDGYVQESGFGY